MKLVVAGPTPSLFDGETGVSHGGCSTLAGISADLDAFYCRSCGQNGRISGAWVIDVLNDVRAGSRG